MARTRTIPALALAIATALTLVLAPAVASARSTPHGPTWGSLRLQRRTVVRPLAIRPAATDANEPDDFPEDAKPIATDGVPVYHTLESLDAGVADADYSSFEATKGHTYQIRAYGAPSSPANTVLYFGDENYLIMFNDRYKLGQKDAAINWTCDVSGKHLAMVSDDYGLGGDYYLSVTDLGSVAPGDLARIAGADRYVVASSIAATSYPAWAGVQHVIVASGLERSAADPLTAAGLAGVYDAPILLINQDSKTRVLPSPTSSAIKKIYAAKGPGALQFHLVGGTVSVPSWVQTRIAAIAPGSVFDRMTGINRYSVAENIAIRMRSVLGTTPAACFVANGDSQSFFFDALAASPVAFSKHYPILLTRKISVPVQTARERAKGYANAYVVGNTYEVAGGVVTTLSAARIGTSASSYDRTYVARRFAEYSLGVGWLADRAHFVAANRLPDAITGGAFAGKRGAALLFSADYSDPGEHLEDYVQQSRVGIGNWWMIGGTASLDSYVGNRLWYLTGQAP